MTLRRLLPQSLIWALALCALVSLVIGPTPTQAEISTAISVDTTIDDNSLSSCTSAANDCSLRGAITKANDDTGDSYTITIPAGVYQLTKAGADEDGNASGDLDLLRSMTLLGAGAGQTIVDANGSDRAFDVHPGVAAAISNLSIVHGYSDSGGGLQNRGGRVTLASVDVISNTIWAGWGGGITTFEGQAMLSDVRVISNTAPFGGGGGLAIMGSAAIVTVTGASLVYHNAAQYGGGIYNAGQLRLDGALVISNTCGDGGGGIHNANGLLTLSGAQVLSNTAGGGGGVYSQGFSAAVTVTAGSLLQGNVAAGGGGIYNLGGRLDVVNARLIANAATITLYGFGGGGVYNSDGRVSLEQAQILSNTAAHDGGGILNFSGNDLSAVTLANVQLIANAAGNYGGAISSAMGTTNPGSNAIVTVTAGSLLEANTSVRGGGVHIFGGQAVLRCSRVISNTAAIGGAIYQENGQASVNGSTVAGNSSVAVQVAGGSTPLDAQQNWWGAVNGPSGSGPGSGDAVSSDVQFAPFVAAPDEACPTLGGTVTGLAGSGLALQNNGGDDLAIGVNGPFTFATGLVNGSAYNVTLKSQPVHLSQTCTVANGAGILDGAPVTNIAVTCITDKFAVGGTVSGLTGGGLVLQNNGGDDLAIGANGVFTFATALLDGSTYNVTVKAQPAGPSQTCTVTNGAGTLAGSTVMDVEVTCAGSTQPNLYLPLLRR